MVAHMVTCRYCKTKFDINKEEFVQPVPRYYYHKLCYEKKMSGEEQKLVNEEDTFFQVLKKYIPDYNYIQSKKLADSYIKKYNFSWIGMAFTLEYYYGICGNSTKGAKDTIGIIPYVYEQAKKYNDKVIKYSKEPIEQNIKFNETVKEYTIESPTVINPLPHLFFEDDEGDN